MRRSAPRSLPTERSRPAATEIDKPDRQQPLKVPEASQPTVIEKIEQRYSDPRVIRMLQQLTREQSKSFFIEVSDLIDSRHLNPATYGQRVDHGLEHLLQGLDVPAFITAAHVQGTGAEIAVFQGELRELRTRLHIRNQQDALATLNDVQHRAAQSLALNPAAVSLEFLYGATDSLDPYSMLLPPEKSGGPSVGLRDTMVGIGVEIESHPAGLKILKPLPGGPAFQADLRVGDIITHVNGHELKSVEINRAVDLILGHAGLPVKIQALRGDRSGVVTLLRQKFAVQSIVDVRIQESSQGIGYLKLEQFAE
jgi:carboxyl-terminal processing protease